VAESRIVTEADVTPHGWQADVCGHLFKPGDLAIALTISHEHGPDPYGLDPVTPDDPWANNYVASDWICEPCFTEEGKDAEAGRS